MSINVMRAVWERSLAGGSELLALLALADWADDDGRCFPSVASIAKKTRLSKSQVQRVVHGLIDAGVVQVEGNEAGGAPGATRRYRILVEQLTGSTGATGRVEATGSANDTRRGRISATGSAGATGRTDAADGSHPCGETGSTHATQTIIEPSVTTRVGGRFDDFWAAWPQSERKHDKAKCEQKWSRSGLDEIADEILADIAVKRQTQKWLQGYIEAPLVYLNGKRWLDGVTPSAVDPAGSAVGSYV